MGEGHGTIPLLGLYREKKRVWVMPLILNVLGIVFFVNAFGRLVPWYGCSIQATDMVIGLHVRATVP